MVGPTGEVNVYNYAGNVDVVADVVGTFVVWNTAAAPSVGYYARDPQPVTVGRTFTSR